jgi:predicted transcriptional regulator of viral defense system
MKGLSKKEINLISYLELNERFFFTRADIRKFFKNTNEMNVYLHRLKNKKKIIKLNKKKYYLIPVKAYQGHWSEHPFIIVDEIMNGKDYYITGMAAANYWGLVEQLPTQIEVRTTKKQGEEDIFDFKIVFKRTRNIRKDYFAKQKLKGHDFLVAKKEVVEKWLESR